MYKSFNRRDFAAGALLAFAPGQSLAKIKVRNGNGKGQGGATTTTDATTTTTTTTATTTSSGSGEYCPLSLDGYGRDNFAGFDWNVQRDTSKAYAIQEWCDTELARHRFEVRGADSWNGESTRNRAEFACRTRMPFGRSVWFSYAMRVHAGEPVSKWNVLGQFHNTPDSGDIGTSPPFSINLLPGENLRFVRRFDAAPVTTSAPQTHVMHERPILRGVWDRVVGRIVFGWENNGAVDIWWNGVKIVSLAGTNIGYNDVRGPYWKFGIYRAKVAETLVADFANLELGVDSLLARINDPLPI